jgi:hypothetical protein
MRYVLKSVVEDDDGTRPVKPFEFSATGDAEAINLARGMAAEQMPLLYRPIETRLCRRDTIIQSWDHRS